tara:strand:+ start:113 stop:406 length:294 start_codon:yes stop_codon:yes gene_type:complete
MKHKNPGASNIFLIRIQTERKQKRFGTPKSSEAKRPTINNETYIDDNQPWSKKMFNRIVVKRLLSFASVAQLAEQGFCKPQVVGSNPITSSRHITKG